MNNLNIKNIYDRYPKSKISEQTKIREILQQIALLGLERQGFFEKAAFYGGTALRILYGLDRFSEDLYFTLLKPDENFDFSPFLEGMRKELLAFGFNMDITKKVKNIETSIHSAFMKMNTIELYLAIGEKSKAKHTIHNEKIQIKLEVDINPPPYARYENQLVLNPVTFYALTLHKSDLFAGKMAAILYRAWKGRVKGRDWYDLIWYIQNKIPLSLRYFNSCLTQAGNLELNESVDYSRLVEMLHVKIKSIDWENAKSDMRSFIAEPERLNIWSPQFFSDLITHLQVE
ncbi:MAG: nucleotidyl transferase AbiEii/AbiGii toxin family protein [Nitrosopumilus sp.]|nr:nucleotidyl transferase AbiEii/AbiGii toxin family protein [Nitrosopumilus sp.]